MTRSVQQIFIPYVVLFNDQYFSISTPALDQFVQKFSQAARMKVDDGHHANSPIRLLNAGGESSFSVWDLLTGSQMEEIAATYPSSIRAKAWAHLKAFPYALMEGVMKNLASVLYLNFWYNQSLYSEAQLDGGSSPAYGDAAAIQQFSQSHVTVGLFFAVIPAWWTYRNQARYIRTRSDHPICVFLIQNPSLLKASQQQPTSWWRPGRLTPLIFSTVIVNMFDAFMAFALFFLGKLETQSPLLKESLTDAASVSGGAVKANADVINIVEMSTNSEAMEKHFKSVMKERGSIPGAAVDYISAEEQSSYIKWVKESPCFRLVVVTIALPLLYSGLHALAIYNSALLMRLVLGTTGTKSEITTMATQSKVYFLVKWALILLQTFATLVKTSFYDLRKMGMAFNWVQDRAEKQASIKGRDSHVGKYLAAAFFSFTFLCTLSLLFEFAASSATASTALSPAMYPNSTWVGTTWVGDTHGPIYNVDFITAGLAFLGAISQMLQCWDAFKLTLNIPNGKKIKAVETMNPMEVAASGAGLEGAVAVPVSSSEYKSIPGVQEWGGAEESGARWCGCLRRSKSTS